MKWLCGSQILVFDTIEEVVSFNPDPRSFHISRQEADYTKLLSGSKDKHRLLQSKGGVESGDEGICATSTSISEGDTVEECATSTSISEGDTVEEYNTVYCSFTDDEEEKEEGKGPKFSSTSEQENEKGRSDFKVTFSEKHRQWIWKNNKSYKLTMNDDKQDWCDEVALWYNLDFNHSIWREGTFCVLVNWEKAENDEPCLAVLRLLNYNVDFEEYQMHVQLNYEMYERQMVAEQENENSPEEDKKNASQDGRRVRRYMYILV